MHKILTQFGAVLRNMAKMISEHAETLDFEDTSYRFFLMLLPMVKGLVSLFEEIQDEVADLTFDIEGVRARALDDEKEIERLVQQVNNENKANYLLKEENKALRSGLRPPTPKEGLSHVVKFLMVIEAAAAEGLFKHPFGSRKIYAIKEMRSETGFGLADAKNAVEAWMLTQEARDYTNAVKLFLLENTFGLTTATGFCSLQDMLTDKGLYGIAKEWAARQPPAARLETAPDSVRTLDGLINALVQMRERSPLKGNTCVYLCREGSGVPNVAIMEVSLDNHDEPGSALVEIVGKFEDDHCDKRIHMKVADDKRQDFAVFFERPGRVDINVLKGGKVLAHVYDGAKPDAEQEPLFCFDGATGGNESCTH